VQSLFGNQKGRSEKFLQKQMFLSIMQFKGGHEIRKDALRGSHTKGYKKEYQGLTITAVRV